MKLKTIHKWITNKANLVLHVPTNRNILFWSVPQRDTYFPIIDKIPTVKTRLISTGNYTHKLPKGPPIDINVDTFMYNQRVAGIVVIHKGAICLEKYGLNSGPKKRWISFSTAKSITSVLLGVAINDGYIKSLDDIVSDYIPDLKGSAYSMVTIKQLLTMTSGVMWNEDYTNPCSDVALFDTHKPTKGMDVTVSYMRTLKHIATPGTEWVYKTGETNLVGVLVSSATEKSLSDYLSEKIWQPFGMETDACWLLGNTNHEIGGCCIQATTRDFARFGLFVLTNDIPTLPYDWMVESTKAHAKVDAPNMPSPYYGYQWWVFDDGSYMAGGIFGQSIFIDPKRQLVIATNCNWPSAICNKRAEERAAFYKKIQNLLDNK